MANRETVYVKVTLFLEVSYANIFNLGKHLAGRDGHPGHFLDEARNQGGNGTKPGSKIGLGRIVDTDGAGRHVRYFFNYDGLI
jgi:hypothetical protein